MRWVIRKAIEAFRRCVFIDTTSITDTSTLAVLDAYGWGNIDTTCEFLLDYEIDEEEWGDKKKPWRYRWPDEVQAEVLARLLELNAERAQAEARAGAAATGAEKKPGKARPRKPKSAPGSGSSPMLFDTGKH